MYRLFSVNGTTNDFYNNISCLTKTLEGISKKDSLGYYKLVSDVYEKYLISNKYFLQKSEETPKELFNLETLLKALKIHTLSTVYDYISKYIKDENLRNFLAFQSMYIGISPFNGPNIYTLIPVVSQLYGLWHLKGGMYSFVNALSKLRLMVGQRLVLVQI